jgi:hypothetical protein
MGTKGHILLHLAAALVGWGIARPLLPPAPDATEAIAPGKASAREARDREAGEKLLRRLVPDLAPAPPAEIVRHEGTLEERVTAATDVDPFSENSTEHSDGSIIGYLRDEIRETLFGATGPDLSYAFFHGRMEAKQVFDTLCMIFPDLAQEKQFPAAVFLELLQVDPARAVILLDQLSPDERSSFLENGDLPMSGYEGPDYVLAILNVKLAIAPETKEEDLRWLVDFSPYQFHTSVGNDYADWLLAQPPSKGRELILESLVSYLDGEDPAAAVALKKRLSNR